MAIVDFLGDGSAEVVLGAPGSDLTGAGAGGIYVIEDALGATDLSDATFLGGESTGESAGRALAGGDLDASLPDTAFADLAVGAPDSSAGDVEGGRAYVLLGSTFAGWGAGADLAAAATYVIEGVGTTTHAGTSLCIGAGLAGDGTITLGLGGPGDDQVATDAGTVALWDFSAATSTVAPVELGTVTSSTASDAMGTSVVITDGVSPYGNLITGAVGVDTRGTNAGAVYEFQGGDW